MPWHFAANPALGDAAAHILTAVLAVAFLAYKARTGSRSLSDIGFARRGVASETIAGLLTGAALISSVIGLLHLCGAYRIIGVNRQFDPWLPLAACLGIAVFEEALFRGYFLRIAEYRYGSLAALVGSSLIFGLLHLLNVVSLAIPFYQKLIGPLFISLEAGLLLGAAYLATRRLWLPIGIHWAWNYFEGPVYGTGISGNAAAQNVLLHSSLTGPFWLTGGAFGPEGSVVCLGVGAVFGAVLLWVAVRRGEWRTTPSRGATRLSR